MNQFTKSYSPLQVALIGGAIATSILVLAKGFKLLAVSDK